MRKRKLELDAADTHLHPSDPIAKMQNTNASSSSSLLSIQAEKSSCFINTRSKMKPTGRFFEVCKRGDWTHAKRRLQTHPHDVNWIHLDDGSTTLHCLVKSNERNPAPLELYHNVLSIIDSRLIMKVDFSGKTIFHHAISSYSTASVDILNTLLDAANEHRVKLLQNKLCHIITEDIVRNCILPFISDEPLLVQDKIGYTALHSWLMWGPYGNYTDQIVFYLKNAARAATVLNNRGSNPLHIMARSLASWSQIECLEAFLINCPSDILSEVLQTQEKENFRVPLHLAIDGIFSHVSNPSYDAVRLLLLANPVVAISSFDRHGNTPLSTILDLYAFDRTMLEIFFSHIPLNLWLKYDLDSISGGRSHCIILELTMRYYGRALY